MAHKNQENSDVVFWHFSDLHWPFGSTGERSTLISTLIEDLQHRIEEIGLPSFCVITGDIAWEPRRNTLASTRNS